MRIRQNDSVLIGFMIGATVPVLGYFCIETIFDGLTSSGMMDEVSGSTIVKRMKTLALLSICSNIIPAQIANNFRYEKIMKGIILATLIYAGFWIAHFYLGVSLPR